MPRNSTTYDLLFSCPGDVTTSCLPIIKEAADIFNRTYGALNNVTLVVRHWSTDSFPESGGAPQELLNEQFVRDCDAAVAVFWTKFGSPTEKYDSGTEEEIEEMIVAGKQVFLYFLEKPIPPAEMDSEGYKKIKAFKEKYKGSGLYCTVKDEQELKQQFTNHLAKYFLTKIVDKTPAPVAVKAPALLVTGENGEIEIGLMSYKTTDSEFIIGKRNSIIAKIDKAKKINLPARTPKKKDPPATQNPLLYSKPDLNKLLAPEVPRDVSERTRSVIQAFSAESGIVIDESFFYIGNLLGKNSFQVYPIFGGGGDSISGTDAEKEKYELIDDIYFEILEYRQYKEFFEALQQFSILSCITTNSGTMHDEDIDVKIYVQKGTLVLLKDIPVPGGQIIEEINNSKILKNLFCREATAKIDSFTDYPVSTYLDLPEFESPFERRDAGKEYAKRRSKYQSALEDLFCYSVFADCEQDILEFNINYLKQHRSVYFPTVLLLKEIPEFIDYEIRSKNSADVIEGRLTIKADSGS
jgi:hypothetical protein